MKKFKAKIYLKNKKELNEYLKNLVKIKKNPTLEGKRPIRGCIEISGCCM